MLKWQQLFCSLLGHLWVSNSTSVAQEILLFLWNHEVDRHVHKGMLLNSVLEPAECSPHPYTYV
jgi:hypothetical protein